MKKLFLSTTLLVGLLSIQAHADYVSQPRLLRVKLHNILLWISIA
jgi:hypothetical protein